MGMFDTVHYKCPHCDSEMVVQVKLGACELQVFHASKRGTTLSPELAVNLAASHADVDAYPQRRISGCHHPGPVVCTSCGMKFGVELLQLPVAVVVPL